MSAESIHKHVLEATRKTNGENEMDTMTHRKIWSGRFLLCVAGCVSFLMLTATCCYGIVVTILMPDANPVLLALVALLSNFLTAIATYYFTKRRDEQGGS